MGCPAACRLTDICTGHGSCPPRPNIQGSPNVFTNNLANHRQTDAWSSHCGHPGRLAKGSSTVFINNLQAGRVGDPVDCGSMVAQGSPNVFIGG